jgi:peptide/nickel transport system permease protein
MKSLTSVTTVTQTEFKPTAGPSAARLWRRYRSLVLGGLFLLPFVLFVIAPGVFAPYDPIKTSVKERLQPPSAEHWFGTDELGRDVYSRVVYGARISLTSASITIAIACAVGIIAGITAGYLGGWADRGIMIATDMVLAFPRIILAMAVAAALGSGIRNAMLAMAAVWWPLYARLLRGLTLRIKEEEYVQAGYAIGGSGFHIIRKHILPNTVSAIIIRVSLDLGFAVLLLASLGFIGLGATAPTPEWGTMVSLGRIYFLTEPWIGIFPALAITLVVIGTTLLGDALNDLWNPTL